MSGRWQYQLRTYLPDDIVDVARNNLDYSGLAPLTDVLRQHQALMKCQFDAFAEYVAEAEAQGVENYPLYAWTKATIEEP